MQNLLHPFYQELPSFDGTVISTISYPPGSDKKLLRSHGHASHPLHLCASLLSFTLSSYLPFPSESSDCPVPSQPAVSLPFFAQYAGREHSLVIVMTRACHRSSLRPRPPVLRRLRSTCLVATCVTHRPTSSVSPCLLQAIPHSVFKSWCCPGWLAGHGARSRHAWVPRDGIKRALHAMADGDLVMTAWWVTGWPHFIINVVIIIIMAFFFFLLLSLVSSLLLSFPFCLCDLF